LQIAKAYIQWIPLIKTNEIKRYYT